MGSTLASKLYKNIKATGASASLELESMAKIDVRGLELLTHGARISRVQTVSRIFGNFETRGHLAPETANEIWMEVAKPLKASMMDPTDVLYTFSNLLTAGKDWFGGIVEDKDQHFSDFLHFMYNPAVLSDNARGWIPDTWRDSTCSPQPSLLQDLLFRPRTDLKLPFHTKKKHPNCFSEAMRGACAWRRILVTEDGHVGLGPRATQPGDVVCILQGAIVPLLLRPEADGNRLKLVGEAYVQGMMFGEVTISQVEQIVLSDKPFMDPVEVEPDDSQPL